MTTIRRIYAYVLALAGLAMLSAACANLAQLLIDVLFGTATTANAAYVRDQAASWGAAALVGLPAWLLHWLWIQRTARAHEAERSSVLRRLYVYAVLAVATLAAASATYDVLASIFAAFTGAPLDARALLRSVPFVLVSVLVWYGHWRVAAADRRQVGEIGGSATLRRWYVYGAAFVGLMVLLNASQALIERLWHGLAGHGAVVSVAGTAAAALVGLAMWLLHWRVLPKRLDLDGGDGDGTSTLRSVYLFLALAVGVVGALWSTSQLFYYALARLLGAEDPGGVGGDLLQAAAAPASGALVYGVLWAYQRVELRHQAAAFSEAPRQAGVRRLYASLVALVALAVLASGVGGLLWTLGDLAFVQALARGDTWRDQVALFATLAAVGLPVWLWHWRPRVEADEARSLARRLYLYLSLIVAALATIAAVADLLYRLLSIALGSSLDAAVGVDVAHALAVGSVAACVAVYQWRALRADNARVPASPDFSGAKALVEIRADDEDALSRALAALRVSGVQVIVR